MDLPKALWTSSSVTINLSVFWEINLLETWDENYTVLINKRFTISLPITYRKLTEDFPKIFHILSWCFLFDSRKTGPLLIFHQFFYTSQKLFRHFHGGYTVKLLLINCSSHTENIRTLVFCSDFIPIGPYFKTLAWWLIRA